MEQKKLNNRIRYFIIVMVMLPFLVLPIKNILLGTFKWHIQQPESWQGMIEIAIFMGILVTILQLTKGIYKIILFWATIILYMMLNGVIIPVFIAYVYLESVKHIGYVVKGKLNIKLSINKHIIDFVIGIIVVSFCMIIMSLLGLGTISDLTILVTILGGVSLIIDHHLQLIITDINNYVKSNNKIDINILFVFIVGIILIQFAKSNRCIDYDSIWYGLRPNQILFGENSFYDNLGMVSFVYYYPKLMELFYAPISGFQDYSFIYSFNIFVLAMLALLIYSFFKDLGIEKKMSLVGVAVIFSIPAIVGMGPTAKTDIFTCFLILTAHNILFLFLKDKNIETMILGLAIAVLSYGAKLTSLLYTTLIIITFFLIILIMHLKKKTVFREKKIHKGVSILFVITILVVLGITYRTYLLTGYPTYKTGANIWEKIGFNGKYPFYGSDEMGLTGIKIVSIKDIIKRIYSVFFDPKNLEHIIMLWTANIYIFYLIFISIFKKYINLNSVIKKMIALNALVFGGAIYYLITMGVPDGNYFIVPIINLIIILISIIHTIGNKTIKKIFYMCTVLMIGLNSITMFVSHSSWKWGTRVFDFNIFKSNFETNTRNEEVFNYHGLLEIYNYLSENNIKVVASGDENIIHRLPGRVEALNNIASGHIGNPIILSSYDEFIKFINWSGVTGFVVDKDNNNFPQYINYINKIQEEYSTIKIDDTNYTLVVIVE